MIVWLAKWILEKLLQVRMVIITDRTELDDQIQKVFADADETLYRTSSGRDLLARQAKPTPRLLCSLVHKFGSRSIDDFEAFIKDLQVQPSQTSGEISVFGDECHRTQSGKFNQVMKVLLPSAVFIGFTGMPLYKADKATSTETFGSDIDQRVGSTDKIL